MAAPRPVDRPGPLLEHLFTAWPEAKRNTVRGWLKTGRVVVNGRTVTRFDHPLRPGDAVAIRPEGFAVPGKTTLPGGLLLRHEDEAVLVVDKPAGLLSIATDTGSERTAYALLTDHVRRGNRQSRARVWIVHRLDRATSGLMVFARTEAAKRALQENWTAAEKRYVAVVEGEPAPEAGLLESCLDESDPLRVRIVPPGPGARAARTRYRVMRRGKGMALLELTLETGRRHQIRAQLAHAGWPIVGDDRYGARTDPLRRLALHAAHLRFPHPAMGEMTEFTSPPPTEMMRLCP